MSRRAALGLIVSVLAGCGHSLKQARFHASSPLLGEYVAAPRPIDWTDGLSFEEFLSGVASNRRLAAGWHGIEAARARREAAATPTNNPEISLDGGQSVDGDETELELSASYVFELGGRRKRRTEAAEKGVDVATAERDDSERDLMARARAAWWRGVAAARRLEIEKGARDLANRLLEAVKARFDARQAPGVEVSLARVRAGVARAALRRSEGELETARAELAAFFPERPPAGWFLAGAWPADRPEIDLGKALNLATTQRADLRVQLAEIEHARARAAAERAEASPDLGVAFGYAWERGGIEDQGLELRDTDHMVTFGFSLSLPFVNKRRGQEREALAEAARAEAVRDALATEIGRGVEASEARMRAASEALRIFEEEVLLEAEKNLSDMRDAYSTGAIGISPLLSAQEDRDAVAREAVEAAVEYAQARSELEAAVGRPIEEYLK